MIEATSEVMVIIPDNSDESRFLAVMASPLKSHHLSASSKSANSKSENKRNQASATAIALIAAGSSQKLARTGIRRFVSCSNPASFLKLLDRAVASGPTCAFGGGADPH